MVLNILKMFRGRARVSVNDDEPEYFDPEPVLNSICNSIKNMEVILNRLDKRYYSTKSRQAAEREGDSEGDYDGTGDFGWMRKG